MAGIIADPKELRRIALGAEISPTTFQRWTAEGGRAPRSSTLLKFLEQLPEPKREALLKALHEANLLPTIQLEEKRASEEQTEFLSSSEVPSAFYSLALRTLETSPDSLRYLALCQLVFRQALTQLDPEREGVAITLVQCSPPAESPPRVRSLRERVRMGSVPPYENRLLEKPPLYFLDAQSLAGRCLSSYQGELIEDLDAAGVSPLLVPHRTNEQSAAAVPLLRAGRVAGCLVVVATRVHFLGGRHLDLLKEYAGLLALALEPEEFYNREVVSLSILPAPTDQHEIFCSWHDRVVKLMRQEASRALNQREAEQLVWREIEAELVQRG